MLRLKIKHYTVGAVDVLALHAEVAILQKVMLVALVPSSSHQVLNIFLFRHIATEMLNMLFLTVKAFRSRVLLEKHGLA